MRGTRASISHPCPSLTVQWISLAKSTNAAVDSCLPHVTFMYHLRFVQRLLEWQRRRITFILVQWDVTNIICSISELQKVSRGSTLTVTIGSQVLQHFEEGASEAN